MTCEAEETALRCTAADCGAVVPVGARFCCKCGRNLNDQQRKKSETRMLAIRSASLSEPVFAKACEEYAVALERGVTRNDKTLAAIARELGAAFAGFASAPPPDEVKRAALEKFTDLQRAALERLGRR